MGSAVAVAKNRMGRQGSKGGPTHSRGALQRGSGALVSRVISKITIAMSTSDLI